MSQPSNGISLSQAVEIAVRNNPDILRAQRMIDAADGRILQAGRIPNPELSISWNEMPFNFDLSQTGEREIAISQQIEFPSKRTRRIDLATFDKTIAALQLERLKSMVAAETKKAYYDAYLSRAELEALEDQQKLLRDFQQLVISKYEASGSTYLDLMRSKVEVARVTNEIAEARRKLHLESVHLNLALGRDSGEAPELSDTLIHHKDFPLADSVVQHLMAQSNLLKIARRTFERQQANVSLAKSSYYPDFTIGISHLRSADQPPFNLNNFTGTTINSLGIGFGVSVPLWFWQEPRGQVQEADALAEVARLDEENSIRRVRANILSAMRSVSAAEEQLRVFDTSLLNDANDVLATALQLFQNNQIDVLNLLDVYRTYRQTQIEYVRALHSYNVALAVLEAAAELSTDNNLFVD